jgi:hypothetical protein
MQRSEERLQFALVDEFAHTNARGRRHPKRYQDVLEPIEASIGLCTELNVPHLEGGWPEVDDERPHHDVFLAASQYRDLARHNTDLKSCWRAAIFNAVSNFASAVIILLAALLLPPPVHRDPGVGLASGRLSSAWSLATNSGAGATSDTGHLLVDPQQSPSACLLPLRLEIPSGDSKSVHYSPLPLPSATIPQASTSVPPELPSTWQFSSRSAPYIRAPTTV